jgi:mRNA interferase YafQ
MTKRGKSIQKILNVMNDIENEMPLDETLKEHSLTGNYNGYTECHIESNRLLIFKIEDGYLIFARTGTHSDLF